MQATVIPLQELLPAIESLERGVERYYRKVAKRFTTPRDLRVFWEEMADQEATHATIIGTLANMLRRNPDMFVDQIRVRYRTVEKIRDYLLTSEAQINSPDFTLDQALAQALELETIELNDIYEKLIRSPKDPFKAVIADLIESEDLHLTVLLHSIKRFATDDALILRADFLRRSHKGDGSEKD